MSAQTEEKPFWLKDNFAPVFEEVTYTDLEVTGEIPRELNGRLLRNGANPQTGWSAHWFLGNGMLHGVDIHDGKANWYRNRYVKTPLYENKDMDPMQTLGDMSYSAANTHIIHHAGKILALEEGHWPFEVSEELETVGPYNFGGKLQGPMTAHPKTCGETGELLSFSYGMAEPYVTYHRTSADGEMLQVEPITVKGATMVHDFNITRNHVIFMDLPVIFDFAKLESGIPIAWSDEYGARLGVMPRDGSDADVRWFDVKTGVVIHTANAWDEGDEVVLQASRSNTADIAGAGTSEGNNLQENQGQLYEWRINLASGEVTERTLSNTPCDFTRVNDNYACFETRYVYASIFNTERAFTFDGVMKYDNASGSTAEFRYGPHRHGGEAVFAPRLGSASEDDGYLVCFVHDEGDNQSECLIIDAQNVEAGPIATIMMPFRVPYGFHAGWVST